MIKILEDNGVDTTCLQQDTSICEDESVLYQDLSDAVAALARKLSSSKTSDKMAEKMKSLQENMTHAQKEADELRALKSATEKRLEASKAAARGSRAETATISAEVDSLREQMEQMTGQLAAAEGKLSSSVDSVSSEVQALEEENIELMKENMELRKETSTYRLEVEKVKAQLIKQSGGYVETNSKIKLSPRPVQIEMTSSVICVQDENVAPGSDMDPHYSGTACLPLTKEIVHSESKTNRSRKAKPLIDTRSNQADGENVEGGECAQS